MMTMINQSHRFSCHLQDLIMKKKNHLSKKKKIIKKLQNSGTVSIFVLHCKSFLMRFQFPNLKRK